MDQDGRISRIRRAIVPPETVLPPPRPGVRYVRVTGLGIVIADDPLRRRVDRVFHWPMIVLALLILPLLAVEFFVKLDRWSLQWWVNTSGLAVIWLAFFVEFVIKVAIAECRIEYCRRNWLDILIILLPALRPFRIARLAKTTRVFTLRGVGMKFLRYVVTLLVGLEATDRVLQRLGLKPKAGRRDPREMTRHQLMTEVRKSRKLIDAWDEWYEAHGEFVAGQGEGLPEGPEVEDEEHPKDVQSPAPCSSPSPN